MSQHNKVTIIIQAHSLLLLSPYGNRAVSRYPADADVRPSDRWHGLCYSPDPEPLRESVAKLLAGMTVPGVRFIRRCTVGIAQAGYVDIPELESGPVTDAPSRRVGNPQYAALQRKLYSARAALSRAKGMKRERGHAIPMPVLEARVQACMDALTAYAENSHDDSKRTPVERIADDVNWLYIACRSRTIIPRARLFVMGYSIEVCKALPGPLPTLPPVAPVNAYNWYDARRAVGTLAVPSVKAQTVNTV